MSAAARVLSQLPKVRRVRENEYRAQCLCHHGKSNTSLSIKVVGDRVLIYCHAGCALNDILDALEMSSARDLFDRVSVKPDMEAQKQARAIRGLEMWSEKYLVTVCEFLRHIDAAIGFCTSVLAMYEDGRLKSDSEIHEGFWDSLGRAYTLPSEYEYQFEILNGRNLQAKLDLWRKVTK